MSDSYFWIEIGGERACTVFVLYPLPKSKLLAPMPDTHRPARPKKQTSATSTKKEGVAKEQPNKKSKKCVMVGAAAPEGEEEESAVKQVGSEAVVGVPEVDPQAMLDNPDDSAIVEELLGVLLDIEGDVDLDALFGGLKQD